MPAAHTISGDCSFTAHTPSPILPAILQSPTSEDTKVQNNRPVKTAAGTGLCIRSSGSRALKSPSLCPAQHPLPQLPTRPAGPLEPQPRCRPGLQLGPGHGGVGEAGGSTAAPGSRSAPCPVQEGYVGVPREGVKGREKGLHTIPEQASARSAGKERVSRQAP